ncbi:MAG: hypothetical protein JRE58_01745 [Deltaproteobacteria bacterium]|nr:hypothetical protein [Deltaproteobacteria bacterium]
MKAKFPISIFSVPGTVTGCGQVMHVTPWDIVNSGDVVQAVFLMDFVPGCRLEYMK